MSLQSFEEAVQSVLHSVAYGGAWLEQRAREQLASSNAAPFACAMLVMFALTLVLTMIFMVAVVICAAILSEIYLRVQRGPSPIQDTPRKSRQAKRKLLRTASDRMPAPPRADQPPDGREFQDLSPVRAEPLEDTSDETMTAGDSSMSSSAAGVKTRRKKSPKV